MNLVLEQEHLPCRSVNLALARLPTSRPQSETTQTSYPSWHIYQDPENQGPGYSPGQDWGTPWPGLQYPLV